MNPKWTTLRLPDGRTIEFDANRVISFVHARMERVAIWTHVGWMHIDPDDMPPEYLPEEYNADAS
jgi:hypothetical protein